MRQPFALVSAGVMVGLVFSTACGCARLSAPSDSEPNGEQDGSGDAGWIDVVVPPADGGAFSTAPDTATPFSGQTSDTGCGFVMPSPSAARLPNPALYDSSQADFVVDQVTGLMWDASSSPMRSAAADAFCHGSRVGGFADWRVPTLVELISIFDFTTTSRIRLDVFPNTFAEAYWTSTRSSPSRQAPFDTDERYQWFVQFGPDPQFAATADATVAMLRVRCTRTGSAPAPRCHGSGARYQIVDGLVSDVDTGLTWQPMAQQDLSWDAALDYCRALGGGFRLPDLGELVTLVDYAGVGQVLTDLSAFPDTTGSFSWTSSLTAADASRAWTVEFSDGSVTAVARERAFQARCVR